MRRMLAALVSGACVAMSVGCAPIGSHELVLDELSDIETDDPQAVPDEVEPASDGIDLRADLPDVRCTPSPPLQEAVEVDDPHDPRGGMLLTKKGDTWLGLPLRKTTFDVVVVGAVAETTVTQTFENTLDHPIEVVYTFPLPRKGAVDDYWMKIGERFVRGVIKRRAEARELYEEAKKNGRTAGLLEQERPNIFTQSVANIPPGASIRVGTHVVQPLDHDDGRYELVLPTVVGPRFIPGTPAGHEGTGMLADTDRVPDASRITPPVLPEGFRTCGDLEIMVSLEPGMPIDDLRSDDHRVEIERGEDTTTVTLDESYALLNRDFVLGWRTAGTSPRAALLTQPGDDGWFTLTIAPPRGLAPEEIVSRELVFVIDASGSMHGEPMDLVKHTVRRFIRNMNPDDAFTVMRFSDEASGLGPSLLENTPRNVERALAYVDGLVGQGGTQMTEGIRAALAFPGDPDRLRFVVFLTDGYIGNEAEIFALLDDRIGEARLFSLGVGAAPNRYLLDGMARKGRGSVAYVDPADDPGPIVDRFYDKLSRPALTDLAVDWGTMDVDDVLPHRIPDLFVGEPIVLYGRVKGPLGGTVTIEGRQGRHAVRIPVALEDATVDRFTGLSSMWARTRIGELTMNPAYLRGQGAAHNRIEKQIVALSLRHRVLSDLTAFVAVDSEAKVDGEGMVETVVQTTDGVAGMAQSYVYGHVAPVGGTSGLGSMSLVGKGGGGGSGSGYGIGLGAARGGRGARVPRVRQASAQVRGSMPKHIIRRIVRAHINEVRGCYNKTLRLHPEARGRVVLVFTISADGKVAAATIGESEIEGGGLGQCITKAARGWTFPVIVNGGTVVVHYPFVLEPGSIASPVPLGGRP